MVIVMKKAEDGIILDVGHAVVDEAELALALGKVRGGHLHVEACKQILQHGRLDHAALDVVDLAQGLNYLSFLSIEVVDYQRRGNAFGRAAGRSSS